MQEFYDSFLLMRNRHYSFLPLSGGVLLHPEACPRDEVPRGVRLRLQAARLARRQQPGPLCHVEDH